MRDCYTRSARIGGSKIGIERGSLQRGKRLPYRQAWERFCRFRMRKMAAAAAEAACIRDESHRKAGGDSQLQCRRALASRAAVGGLTCYCYSSASHRPLRAGKGAEITSPGAPTALPAAVLMHPSTILNPVRKDAGVLDASEAEVGAQLLDDGELGAEV